MKSFSAVCLVVLLLVTVQPSAQQQHRHYQQSDVVRQAGPGGVLAPRLQNLGRHTFKVTTKSARAQLFINQGLNLAYGFNHAEAGRAFAEAARLDPTCAMAYWGQALVLGPNINAAMSAEDEPRARPGSESRFAQARRVAARAGLHRRGGCPLHGEGRRSADG